MTAAERSRALDELREIRLRMAENRLILQALVRSMERVARQPKPASKPSVRKVSRPVRRSDGTWGWPKRPASNQDTRNDG